MDDTIDEDVNNIIHDIQKGTLRSVQIWTKYNISKYRYYKIINEYNLRNELFKKGFKKQSGPKDTKFKRLLYGTKSDQEKANTLPESFNLDEFLVDLKNNTIINEVMKKHNLTIYQVRVLRKKYIKEHTPEELSQLTESFPLEEFIVDCKKKVTLDKLKVKYNLTLYQVRELRKMHKSKFT
jgi:hypothetical protein